MSALSGETELPPPTCPTIDKIITLLEELRQDNAQLRMGVCHYEALYKESVAGLPPAIPSGWALVPPKMTPEMRLACWHSINDKEWSAMLAAAPKPSVTP